MSVPFKAHLNEIMKNYDIISVPKSFIEGIKLPSEGRFFTVQPENP